jgi:bifunctional DNase/RNase
MDKVEVEIVGLSASPSAGGAYSLLLKEIMGIRRLPIMIGAFEAQAIAMALENIVPPRPLTHDLLKSVIDNLGGTVLEVVVTELREGTFYGQIIIDTAGFTNEIDARPSDAIALALRVGAPIYVSENVMQQAGLIPSGKTEESSEVEENEEEQPLTNATKEAKIAALQDQLRKAIEAEEYERAAKLRDEIQRLQGNAN